MRQIVPPIGLVQKILGEQKANDGRPYRLNTHCMWLEQPEGVLLYHTLTGELLLLSREEAAQLGDLPGSVPPALAGLVPRRFLVPEDTDEMVLADQVLVIAQRLRNKGDILTKYVVFTTTDCNARCFYCFQAGIQKATMTEETALAAGRYIATHCGGKPVRLDWFGGEPLVNIRAIDVIADSLRQQGVSFRSTMTSNGYLFDEALVRRAKDDWALKQVQITLDGTEEVYNQRKAYVHPNGSPFQRVLRNIGLLLDAGISVMVRMNMNEDNESDLYVLTDLLAEHFGGKPGFGIYLRVLLENMGADRPSYTEQKRCSLADKSRALWAFISEKGLAGKRPLHQSLVLYSCGADNVNAATITPEGRLGRCETTCESGIWGSVFSEERDEAVLRQWRERRPAEELCKTCVVYPRCIRLKKCPAWPEQCSPIEREEARIRIGRSVLGAYEDWKAAGQS